MTTARRGTLAMATAVALGAALVGLGLPPAAAQGKRVAACPADMVSVRGETCVDRYEAYVVELLAGGKERAHSPLEPVAGLRVKAMNKKGALPQAYISRDEAQAACENAGKRLCTDDEWLTACRGKRPTAWPYGKERVVGRCNDHGTSSFNLVFGSDGQPPLPSEYTFEHLNDPRLNAMPGTLARAGSHAKCKSGFQVFDMVGNLHEWTAASAGTFLGGYYLDVEQHGPGCEYRTTAHHAKYHDYSTGFRCCKKPGEKIRPTAPPKSKKASVKKDSAKKKKGSAKPKT